MGTMIIARTRLSFAVGLDQESAKIRDELIDFLGFLLPPFHDALVQRVGSLCLFKRHWRGEVDTQVHLDIIWAQDVGNLLYLFQVFRRQHLGRSIHVVQHRAVDTYRGIGTGIFLNQLLVQVKPLEDALAGIASFNAAIGIIPVVQQAQGKGRVAMDFIVGHRVYGLLAQQGVCPI